MAKKKASKATQAKKITVTLPAEFGKVDAAIIEGIVRLTLGPGEKFGINEVVVQTSQTSAAGKDETKGTVQAAWDKVC